jgi:hypothetical protein
MSLSVGAIVGVVVAVLVLIVLFSIGFYFLLNKFRHYTLLAELQEDERSRRQEEASRYIPPVAVIQPAQTPESNVRR